MDRRSAENNVKQVKIKRTKNLCLFLWTEAKSFPAEEIWPKILSYLSCNPFLMDFDSYYNVRQSMKLIKENKITWIHFSALRRDEKSQHVLLLMLTTHGHQPDQISNAQSI